MIRSPASAGRVKPLLHTGTFEANRGQLADLFHIVIHEFEIKLFRIERSADPLKVLPVLPVILVLNRVQKLCVTPGATEVFVWTAPFALDAPRVSSAGLGLEDILHKN